MRLLTCVTLMIWLLAGQAHAEVGAACGGFAGVSCGANEYCNYGSDAMCGAGDAQGKCELRPEVCTDHYQPVCGCDGQTYDNKCFAAAAGVNVDHDGPCAQVCGGIAHIPCEDPDEFCKTAPGECCCDFQGVCTPIPDGCGGVYDPVCGCDGVTYGNECEADAAAVSVNYEAACGTGRCCTAFGCMELTPEECEQQCGTFAGVGTTCDGETHVTEMP